MKSLLATFNFFFGICHALPQHVTKHTHMRRERFCLSNWVTTYLGIPYPTLLILISDVNSYLR